MAFGLVFQDNLGDVWTVDVRLSPADHGRRSLLFSRPSFVAPEEQRAFEGVPECWPNCTGDELRAFLEAAEATAA
jgi:hypothetical protein